MANKDHLKILKRGVKAWNKWRKANPQILPDLSDADLRGAKLAGAELDWTNLRKTLLMKARLGSAKLYRVKLDGANLMRAELDSAFLRQAELRRTNLSGANLCDADLRGATLVEANLSGAYLIRSDFRQTSMAYADLRGSDLRGADLCQANLLEADLSESKVADTNFANVNLGHVKGLETIRHAGPSFISINTIYYSKGKIPEVFLRGSGVPEGFVGYMHSLVGQAFEFYSCFISYSSKDQEFATRLHADLQSKGVRCWFAPEDLKIGDKLRASFDEAIRLHDKLMVILSEDSVKSAWVEKEVETAFENERQQSRIVLFPIRLDEAAMEAKEAWAADIRRTRHIGDFRNWKDHDSYQRAFDRLLRDLRAEDKVKSAAQK